MNSSGTHFHPITTEDGSLSLYSEEYGQAMHTVSGAYEEALFKHVRASGVLNLDRREIHVLDVGFGIGYNVLALMEEFCRNPMGRTLEIVTLEKDPAPAVLLNGIGFDGDRGMLYEKIKRIPETGLLMEKAGSVLLLPGDARVSVRKLRASRFHAIFHDPYSPAKNPELWSVDFFRELYRTADAGCVLTTYSGALQVRSGLMEAGFTVGKAPSLGRKREGTLAAKGPLAEPLGADELARLRRDPKATPYRDETLAAGRGEILERRRSEMAARRNG